jgi:hypothetical protein
MPLLSTSSSIKGETHMPGTMGLDGPSSSSSSSSTPSTTQEPAETPTQEAPTETTQTPQVDVYLKNPLQEAIKKDVKTTKPNVIKKK